MATIHSTRFSDTASLGRRLSDLRISLAGRFAQYRVYRTTLNELAMLTDRDLSDLGLHRSNIREIALEAAYKA